MTNKINGKTRLCGVIGNPIEHTLSPLIHNTLAKSCGQNLVYVPFHVRENISIAVSGAYALNVLGMNVTVPYKRAVMDSLIEIDEAAKTIGAVNTLVRTQGGFKGYNTDYLGLKRAMEEDGIKITGMPVMLFGAGGAARAAAYIAGSLGAEELCIVNRTKEKAKLLAQDISRLFPDMPVYSMTPDNTTELKPCKYTAIQATNVGMWPDVSGTVLNNNEVYGRIGQAVDIIFNPSETEFMKRVRAAGGYAVNGLKMLLYQGITAYELWNGIEVSNSLAMEVYSLLEKEFEH